MQSYVGKRLLGIIDRVPGLFYVATDFIALPPLNIPLFPCGSYLVAEGTEQGRDFLGGRIPLQWRSVLLAYLRVVSFGITIPCAFVATLLAFFAVFEYVILNFRPIHFWSFSVGGAAAMSFLHWKAMNARWQIALPTAVAFCSAYLACALWWESLQQGPDVRADERIMPQIVLWLGVIASVFTAIQGLSGVFVSCTFSRAMDYGSRLGVPHDVLEKHFLSH